MINTIFWDFDGVLMNSNDIRDIGFEKVFSEYPAEDVNKLMAFHRNNGGLSRYVKFNYFFEEVRKESVSDDKMLFLLDKFSSIMRELLTDPKLLIKESLEYVKNNHNRINMHIMSGSDQVELRYLC
ncbi:MAG: HAD hydrolase-like protein, partial [Bacteroidota bacterium]